MKSVITGRRTGTEVYGTWGMGEMATDGQCSEERGKEGPEGDEDGGRAKLVRGRRALKMDAAMSKLRRDANAEVTPVEDLAD